MHSKKKDFFNSVIAEIEASISTSNMDFVAYLTNHTYLGGKKFSFKGHEFQRYITKLVCPGKKLSVTKCSQVGISEVFNRIALARARNRSNSGIIISFPTKTMAQNVLKTRFADVISESPDLASQINPNVDNASMKAFRNGSIIHALSGGPSKDRKALLNVPADMLIVDERDRQDPDIVTGFQSRMSHTPEEEIIEVNISTPTASGIGIDYEINQAGEVHTAHIRCRNCKHEFIGDFFSHVRIPNYDDDMEYLTRDKVDPIDITNAYLECPNCKTRLIKSKRDWFFKIEYFDRKDPDHIGVILDPFVAKDIVTMKRLVTSYLDMNDETEFLNQKLGRVAKKSTSQIDETKISIIKSTEVTGKKVFGLDMGKLCHFMSGIIVKDQFVVQRAEIVKLPDIEEFIGNEFKYGNYHAGVMDANPEHATAYKLVGKHPRMFTADYITSAKGAAALSMFNLVEKDKHDELVRLLHVNMSMVMDYLYKNIEIFHVVDGPYTALIKSHFSSMRRIKDQNSDDQDVYKWEKAPGGNDHFWHTLLYFYMASKVIQDKLVTIPSLPILVHKINRHGL
ncbi:phage terminase large subunit family protein [Candidatus Babeliales bacterium]|nr:phage terminase large subunit family protein [Candidatus Babeliales bacterium]